jgi:hypothetical protein
VTLVGRNTGSGDLTLAGTLVNLPAVSSFQFYSTDSSVNLLQMADIPVSENRFAFTVTGGSTFTLTTSSTSRP